jgi:hypothetical protein
VQCDLLVDNDLSSHEHPELIARGPSSGSGLPTTCSIGVDVLLIGVRVLAPPTVLAVRVANNVLGVGYLLIGVWVLARPTVLAVGMANNVLAVDNLTSSSESGSSLAQPSSLSGWPTSARVDDLLLVVWVLARPTVIAFGVYQRAPPDRLAATTTSGTRRVARAA